MKLLLDSCAFPWLICNPEALSPTARRAIAEDAEQVFVSSVSMWEAVQQQRAGRLVMRAPEGAWNHFVSQRRAHDLSPLRFGEDDARHLAKLRALHRDHFDRMLICRAIEQGPVLVSPDAQIRRYPLRTLWK